MQKEKKQTDDKHDKNTEIVDTQKVGKFIGRVKHNYEGSTCTVIVSNNEDKDLLLIPISGLPEKMDKDGTKIRFNFNALKMQQPKGCLKGIPARLEDVTIEK